MDPSPRGLVVPPELTRAQVDERVRAHAPLVKLDKKECHFPSSPEWLRMVSRFRRSIALGADHGWNKGAGVWSVGDQHGREYFDVPWAQIIPASLDRYQRVGVLNPMADENIRPWDSRSIHRRPGDSYTPDGLFLERNDLLPRDASGMSPVGGRVIAPVFFDLLEGESGWVRLLFWFFYELNLYHGWLTHEGDWEHITYYFRPGTFQDGEPPESVYFAQHNGGQVVGFGGLETDGDRPVVYVNRQGHPTQPFVTNPRAYTYEWRTWEVQHFAIADLEWRDFPGAWGEVGFTTHTTGPLGPYFKRGQDQVRVKMVGGRPHLVLASG